MKNLSSKIVIAFSSMALVGAMYACTNTVTPPEDDETSEKVESSASEDVDESSSSIASNSSSSRNDVEESSSSEEEVVSSSSEEEIEESSSSIATSSSSSRNDKEEEVAIPEKVNEKKDSVMVVGKDDVGNKVDEADLPEDLTKGDSLTGDDLFVKEDDLNFDKNDYYCKTPDGDWYVLEGSKYSSLWARFLNFISILFTGKTWLDYTKVCDVIYVHPKY